MAIQKLAHAELRVQDSQRALEFYREVMGLVEIGREGGTVYLGCGLDQNYDLAITQGGTGVAHFAFQVDGEDDLARYRERLESAGIKVEVRNGAEPGQARGIRFGLPTGHQMELVVVEDRRAYLRPCASVSRRRGVTPNDVDHITLSVHAPNVRRLAEFLRDVLGFYISDIFQPAPGVWAAAWTRVGEYHHDLAILGAQEDAGWSLHHLAWAMDGIDHMKRFADQLADWGLPLEYGIGRHGLGGNLYGYFIEPGGNRFEISAEMPRATNRAAEPVVWTDFPQAASAWGQLPPESFARGS